MGAPSLRVFLRKDGIPRPCPARDFPPIPPRDGRPRLSNRAKVGLALRKSSATSPLLAHPRTEPHPSRLRIPHLEPRKRDVTRDGRRTALAAGSSGLKSRKCVTAITDQTGDRSENVHVSPQEVVPSRCSRVPIHYGGPSCRSHREVRQCPRFH